MLNGTVRPGLSAIVLVVASPSPAAAQTASSLIREGDVLVGAPAGHVVDSINSSNTNNNDGFCVELNSSDGGTTLSHIWGSADGTSPGILVTEQTVGLLVQTSYESFCGVANDGSPSYSASGTGGPAGGFDSVWVGTTPIAVEGDPIPSIPGQFWRFASRPGISGDGQPYFVAGITSTSGGNTENRGLFLGANPVAVLLGGDAVPNLPAILSTSNSVSFDYRFSTLANQYIAETQMATGGGVSTSDDNVMVVSGSGLLVDGTLVREGNLVPAVAGGDGTENWDNFDFTGINENGDWFFSGDTDGATATDEIIVRNGVIVFREGDVVDGQTLTGSIEGAFMSECGSLAYIWDVDDGGGGSLEALFYESTFLLAEGDAVDWDGDGTIDAGFVIDAFTGISAMSVGSDNTIYFTADIDDGTTVLEGLFAIAAPAAGTAYCFGDGTGTICPCGNPGAAGRGCANGSDPDGARLQTGGTASLSAADLVLCGSGLAPNQPGLYFQGDNAVNGGLGNAFGDGIRCAGGNVVRLQVVNADSEGASSTTDDIGAEGGVSAGDTKRYQLWYRDPMGTPCGNGFNLSNGVELVWQS